ncbi:hypothetical protein ACFVIM_28125 [Streptomyces sp. NPDC057638]|uniref:hypothetical protein n=1 Tax=Streptomyces sp. NPDC057638 TaxID=3346190 RepID=UPI0036D123A1
MPSSRCAPPSPSAPLAPSAPPVLSDADEEAVVRRIQAQNDAFAALDSEPRTYAIRAPVLVTVHGEQFAVPLTVKDVRRALPGPSRDAFDEELSASPPHTLGRVIRRWALEVIPGDALDRVDVLLRAEQLAARLGTAAA